jgi:hypothetical protein
MIADGVPARTQLRRHDRTRDPVHARATGARCPSTGAAVLSRGPSRNAQAGELSSICRWTRSRAATDDERVTRTLILLIAVAVLGCGGDDGGGGATPDAAVASRACDGRAYDLCTDTTNYSDCQQGFVCRLYGQQNFTICSPLCDANNPCPPDEHGTPVTCNTMGRCRSNAPNSCTK